MGSNPISRSKWRQMKTKTKRLKRTNWTTKELVSILNGRMVVPDPDSVAARAWARKHNEVIKELVDYFEVHFLCDRKAHEALAMDTKTGEIVHIGTRLPRGRDWC